MSDKDILSSFTGIVMLRWQNYKELDRKEKLAMWIDFLVRNAIFIIIIAVVI